MPRRGAFDGRRVNVSGPSDEQLLRRLRRARGADPPDRRAEIEVEAQLLARYDAWLRRVAAARVGPESGDEVVNRTLESIARRLGRDLDLPKELWRIGLDYLEGDIKDHWRASYGRRTRETVSLDHEAVVPERGVEDETLTAEAVAFREFLTGSSDPDIQLLGLRLFAGLSPQKIADQSKKTRGAVDTALSRAIAKVREREAAGVRDFGQRADR